MVYCSLNFFITSSIGIGIGSPVADSIGYRALARYRSNPSTLFGKFEDNTHSHFMALMQFILCYPAPPVKI